MFVDKIFERATIRGIADYLLFGMGPNQDNRSYEEVSKLRWRLMDQNLAPVTLEEAFYMATIGGGSFFGKVGSFEKGYEFDAMILDDHNIRHPQEISTRDRLERLVYLSDDRNLVGKYVQGRKVI